MKNTLEPEKKKRLEQRRTSAPVGMRAAPTHTPAPGELGPSGGWSSLSRIPDAPPRLPTGIEGRRALLAWQGAAGNQAILRLVQASRDTRGGEEPPEQDAERRVPEVVAPRAPDGPSASRDAPLLWPQGAAGNRAGESLLPGGSGQPLDPRTRALMEARFGEDFEGVRLHTGPAAEHAADALGAEAFTVRRDIVLGRGGASEALLAHELAHVVQQAGPRDPAAVSEVGDAHERAAEATGDAVARGEGVALAPSGVAPGLQRQARAEPVEGFAEWGDETRALLVRRAEAKIAELDEALTNGYLWGFEWGDHVPAPDALEDRAAAMRQVAAYLREFADAIAAGKWYFDEKLTYTYLHAEFSFFLQKTHGIDLHHTLLPRARGRIAIADFVNYGSLKSPVLPPATPSGAARAQPDAGAPNTATPVPTPDAGVVAPPRAREQAPPPKKKTSPPPPAKAAEKPPPKRMTGKQQGGGVPKATPKQEEAPKPTPTPTPVEEPKAVEPAKRTRRKGPDSDVTGWYVEILDPATAPQEVFDLLPESQAHMARIDENRKMIRSFKPPLRQDADGRYYYVWQGKRIDLPNLLERFPRAAEPAR